MGPRKLRKVSKSANTTLCTADNTIVIKKLTSLLFRPFPAARASPTVEEGMGGRVDP